MSIRRIAVLILLLFASRLIMAQPTGMRWYQGYQIGTGLVENPMGGYFATAVDDSNRFQLLTLDTDGNIVSETQLPGSATIFSFTKMVQCVDHGFAILFYTPNQPSVLRKYRPDLTLQWQRTLDADSSNPGFCTTSDTGFYLTSVDVSSYNRLRTAQVRRLNSNGGNVSTVMYGGAEDSHNEFNSICTTWDGYIAGGRSYRGTGDIYTDSTTRDMILKESHGAFEWSRTLHDRPGYISDIKYSRDHNFIISSNVLDTVWNPDSTYSMMWNHNIAVKVNEPGRTVWEQPLGVLDGKWILPTREGGFLFDSYESIYNNMGTMQVNKLSSTGSLQWIARRYVTAPTCGLQTSDGGYLLFGSGLYDTRGRMFLMKLDSLGLMTNVAETTTPLPTSPELLSCYPNPFNSTTMIQYSVPLTGLVNVSIYNTLGQRVAELVNELYSTATSSNRIAWNADALPAGVYFVRLQSQLGSSVKKVLLVK